MKKKKTKPKLIKKAFGLVESFPADLEDAILVGRYQLGKLMERERLAGMVDDEMQASESRRQESLATAWKDHRELKRRLDDQLEEAERLNLASMREAEKRLTLVLEKWDFGKSWKEVLDPTVLAPTRLRPDSTQADSTASGEVPSPRHGLLDLDT